MDSVFIMAEKDPVMESSPLKRSWECLNENKNQNSNLGDLQDYNDHPEIIKRSKSEHDFADPQNNAELSTSCFMREHSAGSGTDDSADQEVDEAENADTPVTSSRELEEEDEDADDTVSEISDISGISIEGWRPVAAGPMVWVQQQMMSGKDPLPILKSLIPDDTHIPAGLDELTLWKIIINILSEPPKRSKLSHVNSLDDIVHLLQTCKNVMVLTGAGVSVSCGIPDFRSRDGVYARLALEYPDLPDPQAMFDINYFRRNPRPFFKFAKEIYPGQFKPSLCHQFIKLLEDKGKLLRNYTQNIDTLEQVAGISKVIQCHGSFATATCMNCKHKVQAEAIKADIMNQVIPACTECETDDAMAIMKPDIVFFGESLPEEFHKQMEVDKDECDLLIVIGSSLKVRPVALVPNSLPANVPQILINREPLRHLNFDVELLGDCDVIINELCHRLSEGWRHLCTSSQPASQITSEEHMQHCTHAVPKDDSRVTSTDETSQMSVVEGPSTVQDVDLTSDDSTSYSVNMTGDESCSSSANNVVDSTETVFQISKVDSTNDNPISVTSDESMSSTTNEVTGHRNHNNECDVNTPAENKQSKLNTTGCCDDNMSTSDMFRHNQSVNRTSQNIEQQTVYDQVSASDTEVISSQQAEVTSTFSCNRPNLREDSSVEGTDASDCQVGSSEAESDEQKKQQALKEPWLHKDSIAKQIPENKFVHVEPCRYIFHGAEVMLNKDKSDDEDDEEEESSFDDAEDEKNEEGMDAAATTSSEQTYDVTQSEGVTMTTHPVQSSEASSLTA